MHHVLVVYSCKIIIAVLIPAISIKLQLSLSYCPPMTNYLAIALLGSLASGKHFLWALPSVYMYAFQCLTG